MYIYVYMCVCVYTCLNDNAQSAGFALDANTSHAAAVSFGVAPDDPLAMQVHYPPTYVYFRFWPLFGQGQAMTWP